MRDASGLYAEWGSALGIRQVETLNVMQIPEYRTFFFNNLNRGRIVGASSCEIGARFEIEFARRSIGPRPDGGALHHRADELGRVSATQVAASYPLVFDDREAGVRVFENIDAFPACVPLARARSPAAAVGSDPRRRGNRTVRSPPTRAFAGRSQSRGRERRASTAAAAGDATIVSDHNTRTSPSTSTRRSRQFSCSPTLPPQLVGHGERRARGPGRGQRCRSGRRCARWPSRRSSSATSRRRARSGTGCPRRDRRAARRALVWSVRSTPTANGRRRSSS